MFKKLTDFSYKRTTQQAIGFYIAYFVATILVAMILSGIFASDFSGGAKIGSQLAIVVSLVLGFYVIQQKKLTKNFNYILLVILAGVLSLFGGALLGLIPVAYLTTK